jgi:PncC family amidohydrolase
MANDVSPARLVVEKCAALSLRVVLAESCTGGLAADLIARVPGASRVLWGSFVAYTPEAKTAMLGIDPALLAQYGLVSRETALAMARGALERSGADLAVSVTGLAGPGGDGSPLPVGTVWIGFAGPLGASGAELFHYAGDRPAIRNAAAAGALSVLVQYLRKEG